MRTPLVLALAALIPCTAIGGAPEEIFSIDWSTIDGGGGTSTSAGGEFSVSGTIGQPDTSRLAGGPFSLQGGFWGRYGVIQTPGAPLLTIERLTNGDLRVAWELSAEGWVLDKSPNLGRAPTPWTEVDPATYQANATHNFIVVPNTGRNFYGLRLP